MQLRTEVGYFKQQSRANIIEIYGISAEKGANVIDIVRKIGNVVGIFILDNDIFKGNRISLFPSNESKNQLKSIVVKFSLSN